MKFFVVTLLLLALIGAAGGWYWHASSKPTIEFKTAKVDRGELLATISATGTLEPEDVVDVGAQVAGLIQSFGKDESGKDIDYDSKVKAGMLLAKIDDAVYRADRDTASAGLAQAKAMVLKGNADLAQANAKLGQAKSNWDRASKVGPDSDALSKNDYDMYKADYETAVANVSVAKAEIAQADTGVQQAKAALDKAQRNFEFCTIRSPVDGVIIARRVNIGQTVVSALNAPSLFLIGKDMTRMQIWVAVNEADIGHIHPKQNVTFTCDSFPGRVFTGIVNKIRLNAQMTQNVVTYTVEIDTHNDDGTLLPYLTANVKFEVQKHENVLLVPNIALRWYPTTAAEVVPEAQSQWKPLERASGAPWSDQRGATHEEDGVASHNHKKQEKHGLVWVKNGDLVRPVDVTVVATDNINTEVSGDGLKEGDEVVVGEIVHTEADSGMHNPFLPQMSRSKRH